MGAAQPLAAPTRQAAFGRRLILEPAESHRAGIALDIGIEPRATGAVLRRAQRSVPDGLGACSGTRHESLLVVRRLRPADALAAAAHRPHEPGQGLSTGGLAEFGIERWASAAHTWPWVDTA